MSRAAECPSRVDCYWPVPGATSRLSHSGEYHRQTAGRPEYDQWGHVLSTNVPTLSVYSWDCAPGTAALQPVS